MWSSPEPLLCCGKSKRQRCVPLTSLIQASAGLPAAAGAWASSVAPVVTPTAAAAPNSRPRNPRRFALSSVSIRTLLVRKGIGPILRPDIHVDVKEIARVVLLLRLAQPRVIRTVDRGGRICFRVVFE